MELTAVQVLLTSAVSIGFIHTLIGVDHSLPFVVLGKAQGWKLRKVLFVTFLCGFGHVASSVLLGVAGVALGVAVGHLEWIEGFRGSLASWTLIIFGLTYAAWSMARQRRRQRHIHQHGEAVVHSHEHSVASHRHSAETTSVVTAWSLFIVFVLGPCEPLIPLLMFPAMEMGLGTMALVTAAFAVTTIGTMLLVVTAGFYGLEFLAFRRLESHANTLAGLAIAASGLAILFLGI